MYGIAHMGTGNAALLGNKPASSYYSLTVEEVSLPAWTDVLTLGPGIYSSGNSENAATFINAPFPIAFKLVVEESYSADYRIYKATQIWKGIQKVATVQRSTGVVTPWQELTTEENGTWTPTLSGTVTSGVWIPASIVAAYRKTANHMTVNFFIAGSFTGASGSLQILGLPAIPVDYYGIGTVCYASGLQATGVTNALNMVELTITNAGAPVQAQAISGGITLCGDCTYRI